MSALAKSFSAVLLALLFSLAAFSDPLPPDLNLPAAADIAILSRQGR